MYYEFYVHIGDDRSKSRAQRNPASYLFFFANGPSKNEYDAGFRSAGLLLRSAAQRYTAQLYSKHSRYNAQLGDYFDWSLYIVNRDWSLYTAYFFRFLEHAVTNQNYDR